MLVVAAGQKWHTVLNEQKRIACPTKVVKSPLKYGGFRDTMEHMQIQLTSVLSSQTAGCAVFVQSKKSATQSRLPASLERVVANNSHHVKNSGSALVIPHVTKKTALLIFGLGKDTQFDQYAAECALHRAIKEANILQLSDITIIPPIMKSAEDAVFFTALHAEIANYAFTRYVKGKKIFVKRVTLLVPKIQTQSAVVKRSLARARIIAQEINASREIANVPGSDMTPTLLAHHAQNVGKQSGFSVRVFDEKKMKELGMGGILGVSHGSDEEAKFIICEYAPANAVNKKPIVFVGKGVTFDTGGLNIKPEMSMYEMHLDMSGGAAVIHALAGIARLKLPVRAVALIPAAENMPSGSGYRPGDVLTAFSGKTIEVKHTDAEGRIVLADALGYAKTFHPDVVIDIATLTGAVLSALGQRASAVLSPDDSLLHTLAQLGAETGDRVWPFPLWKEFRSDVKGHFADVQNVGKNRHGGVIIGAAFLWEFAPVNRWAHIDIASTMTTIEEQHLAPGSRGSGVHLLIRFAEWYAETKHTTKT
jgi:leucyl aminopeptidase